MSDTSSLSAPLSRLATARRAGWLVNALFWSALGVMEGVNHGWTAGLFALVFFVGPDLTMLVGAGDSAGTAHGQLPVVPCRTTTPRTGP
ncbi:hypothetical protein NKH18_13410 [Streptomyces sp. M10(2022)]